MWWLTSVNERYLQNCQTFVLDREITLFTPDFDCFCFVPILRNLLSLFCKFDDISDAALCHDLIVCIESKYFMKLISKVSSCIGRLISRSWDDM